ncbi:DNA repair ATPase [Streptomyces xanthophaeus]|uniref:DNA repair ATPase n=1 Tax=Streptomyces xanthophaeus TaxID=67385 RepID=UPI00398FE84C
MTTATSTATATEPKTASGAHAGVNAGVNAAMDDGTYEVLRDRLTAQATELTRRTEALNAARIEEFGSTGLALSGSGRLRTEENRTARGLVAVGDVLLFGCNGAASTGPDRVVSDVLALYDRDFNPLPADAAPGLLDDPDFVREFTALHRYFREARLLQLRRVDGRLLAVFRTGELAEDIRVLRWSLTPDGRARFLDAQGERDHVLPPAYDVEWRETTREDHVQGRHPHVSIDGRLFVSTVGGALTVKTEDDTESEEGVHHEPVHEALQSLADAEIAHATVGPLLLLRIRPYKEEARRHLVFNSVTGTAVRLDGIGQSCRRLPDDEGIVFPGGYCLASGTVRTFDPAAADPTGLEFERTVRSPNGEDVLFAFHARAEGRTLLLPYNVIRKEVSAPISCHGHALFDDGTLVVLRAGTDEPARTHPVQTWQTPFTSDTHPSPTGNGPLGRIGNADLVRGIADCLAVARQAETGSTPGSPLYEALLAACVRTADQHPWLGDTEAGDLRSSLEAVRATAEQVLDEYATVTALTRQAADALAESAQSIARLVRRVRGESPATAEEWIERIAELRRAQGHLLTLAEMRYADTAAIETLSGDVTADIAAAGKRAVAFLSREDAFDAQAAEAEQLAIDAGAIPTVAETAPLRERLEKRSLGLQALAEVVADLDTGDATVRTAILTRIAEVLAGVNRALAAIAARRRELLDREGRAGFTAEFALLGQAVNAALAAAGTPEECASQLARLLLRLENLDARYAEHDGFLAEIDEKRAEVHDAFSTRRQTLQDARARRAEKLADSARRVLETIARRAAALDSADGIHTYFASDPMVARVRRTADELRELGDTVRAEELAGLLSAARQEAGRALRDRTELFADGGETMRLGRHRFAVTRQAAELTLVPHGDGLAFALTGTDYRRPVTDPQFAATRPFWDRLLPSESAGVYRAEYLAARLLVEHRSAALAAVDLDLLVREAAESAYDEGYERGVHDHDAVAILRVLLDLHESAGLLRYAPRDRAAATLYWAHGATSEERSALTRRAVSLARARDTFGPSASLDAFQGELAQAVAAFAPDSAAPARAAEYLFEELSCEPAGFAVSSAARTLLDKFRRSVGGSPYDEDLAVLPDLAARGQLVEGWLTSYAAACGEDIDGGDISEAVAAELCPGLDRYDAAGATTATVSGLLGAHPRISGRSLVLRLDEFLARNADFAAQDVPGFRTYQWQRGVLTAAENERLRIDAHRPRVMSSFVRNRLVDEVYLPLIGENLAKQIGAAGKDKRTDSSGLLMLISPPGYGKTTLVEYVAERLGLLLVKIDGPSLGHRTTSLDPEAAPDATARRELEKIAFALEAGNNVMLYLDDIQHTSPELLQKFIPLCDTTRTLGGRDLRGKRFAVCMAGNPYTESGQRFRVPDMLANRADVWNLGDVLTGKGDAFALSFVENALTSNPVLAPLAARDRTDLELLVRLAAGDLGARRDRLAHPYPPGELDRILAVLRHFLTARKTVLAVNSAYIASAAQSDASRAEPPFRLQGSYRNMNKIAARISPAMNDAELTALIDDHYTGEAQTLTTEAEANLLKLASLRGTLTPDQAKRWAGVTASYVRAQALGGRDDDPLTRAVAALGLLADRVAAVEGAITRATDPRYLLALPSGRHAARTEHDLRE